MSELDEASASEACAGRKRTAFVEAEAERDEGGRLMVSAAAVGGLNVLATVALGATCPLCLVGTPALFAWGAYRRYRAARELELLRHEGDAEGPRLDVGG